jgi:redox-sensitive bicupin YhaK (pirin superfamily)
MTTFTIKKSNERGWAEHGWLKSYHSFSFADYYDPNNIHFGPLRVINEDYIAGGTGFGTHPHADMEIISYLVAGGIRHRDSMGNEGVVRPGEIQYMSAGTGVQHSEYNASQTEEAHLLQIWIVPDKKGVAPRYGQKSFAQELEAQKLVRLASPDGQDGSIAIHQNANVYASRLRADNEVKLELPEYRRVWVQAIRGSVSVNGQKLEPGDAASAQDVREVVFKAEQDSEFLVFDLP